MISIERLGALTPDPDIDEWLVSGPVELSYFGNARARFIFDGVADDTNPGDHAAAVERFLALGARDREMATPYVFQYYRQLCEVLDESDIPVQISAAPEVWRHIEPEEIIVKRRSEDGLIYVQAHCSCAWEIEHGIQLVFRGGAELSRVSDIDGHLTHSDACALPDSEDRII
jgi:hypothetical protein